MYFYKNQYDLSQFIQKSICMLHHNLINWEIKFYKTKSVQRHIFTFNDLFSTNYMTVLFHLLACKNKKSLYLKITLLCLVMKKNI